MSRMKTELHKHACQSVTYKGEERKTFPQHPRSQGTMEKCPQRYKEEGILHPANQLLMYKGKKGGKAKGKRIIMQKWEGERKGKENAETKMKIMIFSKPQGLKKVHTNGPWRKRTTQRRAHNNQKLSQTTEFKDK